jgi:hypothetical protein
VTPTAGCTIIAANPRRLAMSPRIALTALVVLVGSLALGSAACGDGDDTGARTGTPARTDTSTTPVTGTVPETTVEVLGEEFTCETLTGLDKEGIECNDRLQAAFDASREGLPDFVLNKIFTRASAGQIAGIDAAYAGLIACVFLAEGNQPDPPRVRYLRHMRNQPDFASDTDATLLVPYEEARRTLCP